MLVRRTLPSPASVQVYELTPWGQEIEPVMQTMGRWATRSPLHDPTLPMSPASAMLSMRTMIDPVKAGALRMTIGFRVGGDRFLGRLADGVLGITRMEPAGADVVVEADPTPLVVWLYVKRPVAAMEADGVLRIVGDRAAAERFADLFALPPKIMPPAG
ncbi:transcriptional regulator [Sphingomonas insulae]